MFDTKSDGDGCPMHHLRRLPRTAAAIALPMLIGPNAAAFEGEVSPQAMEQAPVYSPYAGRGYPDRVLFGDLHFHTEISVDAGLVGTTLSPHEAFRFARGEEIISNTGQRVQLVRPLDFLAVTEHAEFLGLATAMRTADPRLARDDWGGRILAQFNSGQEGRMAAFGEILRAGSVQGVDPVAHLDLDGDIWTDLVEVIDQYNDPGVFSTLAGFEWSSTPQGDNLHRIVLFRDGAERTGQTRPLSLFDTPDPEAAVGLSGRLRGEQRRARDIGAA